jgi:hypothetical protein
MRRLTELPEGAVLVAHRSHEVYLYRIGDSDRGVLVNPRVESMVELPLQSALARGYWEPIEEQG